MGASYRIIVEENEYGSYAAVIDAAKILVLDRAYQRDYDTCDNLGDARSKGPGPARNFAWDHATATGAEWHWVMDDNIRRFYRYNRNLKVRCRSGAYWRAMEDFILRYENVYMAGPAYYMFIIRKKNCFPPFVVNTRIYSCNLIRCITPFRWRGRYNEDTDLSIRILKAGYCTIQFNAFLQEKMPTQTMKGGCTDEFYRREGKVVQGEKYARLGTLAKSQMIVEMHPDVASLVWKFGRWHHHVDYRSFKGNRLIRRNDIKVEAEIDNYGMRLIKRST